MRPIKIISALACSILIFYACQKTGESSPDGVTTTVRSLAKVYLTDDQDLQFDKVFIDLQKLEIKLEDNGIDSLGGWFSLAITPGVYDILQFRNGVDTLFGTGTIPANRKLQKIRLTLGDNNSVVIGSQTFKLKLKDNEVVANLDESNVEFIGPDQLRFWLDFDAGRSIKKDNSGSGNNNGYELRPRIRIFSKSKSGRIEGRVTPTEAAAMIMAINGQDTATAKPEREGEFKIVGLKAGTYQLYIDATSNNYKDTILTNIVVKHNEDTKVGTIVLRK